MLCADRNVWCVTIVTCVNIPTEGMRSKAETRTGQSSSSSPSIAATHSK
jgi:hypothetical protein